jgi:adenine-specific DNA glycosylase
VARRGERFLVVQRPETGLWSRMWQVPTVEADEMLAPGEIGRRLDVAIGRLVHRGEFVHATTHRRIHVRVYSATSRARRGRWLTIDELESIPMSNAARRAISLALDNQ